MCVIRFVPVLHLYLDGKVPLLIGVPKPRQPIGRERLLPGVLVQVPRLQVPGPLDGGEAGRGREQGTGGGEMAHVHPWFPFASAGARKTLGTRRPPSTLPATSSLGRAAGGMSGVVGGQDDRRPAAV